MPQTPPLSRDEIALMARRAGLDLTPEQFDALAAAAPHVEAMAARLPRPRARSDEAAHVFRPICRPAK